MHRDGHMLFSGVACPSFVMAMDKHRERRHDRGRASGRAEQSYGMLESVVSLGVDHLHLPLCSFRFLRWGLAAKFLWVGQECHVIYTIEGDIAGW